MSVQEDIPGDANQVFLALCYSGKVLGLASFEELNGTIFCDSISVSVEDMEPTITNLKMSFRPTMFLLHPKIIANKSLLDLILAGVDGSENEYRFKVLKSSVWNENTSRRLIHTCLEIRSRTGRVEASSYQQLSCLLDLETEHARQAIGAIVAYMQETVFKLDGGKVIVSGVRKFVLESYMRIDAASFNALQIFAEEIHPNVMKGKGRSKEGFSLFGLFDRTHSLSGRLRLRDWMSRPFCDKARIEHRQRGVALTSRQCNRDFVAAMSALLRHFHDLPRLVLRVKKVEATHLEWCKIHISLVSGGRMLESIHHFTQSPLTDPEDSAYIQDLCTGLDPAVVHQLTYTLQSAIDFVETESAGSVVFREAHDAQLDRMRQVYDQLESLLAQAAHRVLEIVPLLQKVTVEYVPQVGYLVAVHEHEVHLLDHILPPTSIPTVATAPATTAVASAPAYGPVSRPATAMQSSHYPQQQLFAQQTYQQQPYQQYQQYNQQQQPFPSYSTPNTAPHVGSDYYGGGEEEFLGWADPPSNVGGYNSSTYTDNRYDTLGMSANNYPQQVHVVEPEEQPAQDESFRFVYKQAGVYYFKQRIVEEMDVSIGDIKSEITDRQRYLLLQLEDALLDSESQLMQLSLVLSSLDALISLGTLAVEQRLTKPEITEDTAILIKGGRHLLQELTVDNFVPNDTYLNAHHNVALISGPNTSGKSVYLKQVALIVYLAHIGSFVPAERARIGLTDRIMTRITSTETVSAPQSAFALDLQQVSMMLTARTPRTLCLIDEFGKGTMPVDGIALLAACVKHFAATGTLSMFVLHFTEILHDRVLDEATLQSVSCFRMETLDVTHHHSSALLQGASTGERFERTERTERAEDFGSNDAALDLDYQERTPLFKLRKGVAPSSEGIPCARAAAVPEPILQRAVQIKQAVLAHRPIPAHPAAHHSTHNILQNASYMKLLATFMEVKDWSGAEGEERFEEFRKLL